MFDGESGVEEVKSISNFQVIHFDYALGVGLA
jgi:hypothetical protein